MFSTFPNTPRSCYEAFVFSRSALNFLVYSVPLLRNTVRMCWINSIISFPAACIFNSIVNIENKDQRRLQELFVQAGVTRRCIVMVSESALFRLSNLVKAREQDKCSMQLLEKRLIEAHAKKNELEKELNAERRSKLKEEHAAARALAAAQSIK